MAPRSRHEKRPRMERIMEGTAEERIIAWIESSDQAEDKDLPSSFANNWTTPLQPYMTYKSSTKTPTPRATFAFTVQRSHCNAAQNLHGGCTASLFDLLTSLALCLVDDPPTWKFLGVSRSLNVTYLRPVPLGTEVLVECEVVHAGRRMASLRGEMRRSSDGLLLATCEHGKVSTDPVAGGKA